MISEAIFHLLDAHSCEHFKAFETRIFEFPSSEEFPSCSKTVDTITKIMLRNFWAKRHFFMVEKTWSSALLTAPLD
jgi:hypothetical protein